VSRLPASNSRRVHRCGSVELCSRRSALPFLKLQARSEHSLDANRMSEASRRGPPPSSSRGRARPPPPRSWASLHAQTSRSAPGQRRDRFYSDCGYFQQSIACAAVRRGSLKALKLADDRSASKPHTEAQKTSSALKHSSNDATTKARCTTKPWPTSRRARRASARERPPRR
jgi:hypothetical protein